MTTEKFVPIEDLANHFSVSVSTIRSWVRQEHIPKSTYLKVGSTYRFSITKVADALLAGADDFDGHEVEQTAEPAAEMMDNVIEDIENELTLDDDF
jgi:hypothetical protein